MKGEDQEHHQVLDPDRGVQDMVVVVGVIGGGIGIDHRRGVPAGVGVDRWIGENGFFV